MESEKKRKYDVLASELSMIHKCKVVIIPYVLTWDGVVIAYHVEYRKQLKICDQREAYIQSKVLHKTFEGVSLDFRRRTEERSVDKENVEVLIQRLEEATVEAAATAVEQE